MSERSPSAAKLPESVGLNPLLHEWVVSETEDDVAVIFVRCALPSGMEFAHVLFAADWADGDHAAHVAKLHNRWLAKRKEAGLV